MKPKNNFIEMRVRVTDDGGLLYEHLQSLSRHIRTARLRSLSITGLLFEMGLTGGALAFPSNISSMAELRSSVTKLETLPFPVPADAPLPPDNDDVELSREDLERYFGN